MEIKRTVNEVKVYDDNGRQILYIKKIGNDMYKAINAEVTIEAELPARCDKTTVFSFVSLEKRNKRGIKKVNRSQKWETHYTKWLESICREYGLL